MKYPYIVNYNGKWYPAGTEVPTGANAVSKSVEAQNSESEPKGEEVTAKKGKKAK